jgi:hypothetical protein
MYEPSEEQTNNPYNDRFNELGFDSMSMVYNMGDLSLIQFYVLVLLGRLIFYKLQSCCCSKNKDKASATSLELMFNWPLRFFMEAYFEICFGSWMKYLRDDLKFSTKTDSMDTVLTWFWFSLSFSVPVLLALLIYVKEKAIREKGAIYERIESIFEDIRLDTWYTMNYPIFFFLRRISLVAVVFFCEGDKAVF